MIQSKPTNFERILTLLLLHSNKRLLSKNANDKFNIITRTEHAIRYVFALHRKQNSCWVFQKRFIAYITTYYNFLVLIKLLS